MKDVLLDISDLVFVLVNAVVFVFVDVIFPDFSLELTGFFPGKHSIHFLVLKMKDFRNFVLDNLTLNKFT